MNAIDTQIRTIYEVGGLPPEEIAKGFNLTVDQVESILIQCSKLFRAIKKSQPITDVEKRHMLEIIKDLAINAESEGVRLKAAQYIHDESCGRNDPRSFFGGMQINVTTVNGKLERMNALKDEAIKRINDKYNPPPDNSDVVVEAEEVKQTTT